MYHETTTTKKSEGWTLERKDIRKESGIKDNRSVYDFDSCVAMSMGVNGCE